MAMKMISVTDIKGFKLGNAENREKGTGCTVIVCEEGAVGGVDVRGGGPATRETDLLRSENTVNAVNAVVLSGGSAFGLEAASGVMRELAERKIGFDAGDDIVVPIVCGASLYDLPVGDPKAFPDIYMGAQAVRNAYTGFFSNGNHGAGTGATVGKMKGYDRAMKTGLGTFACGDGVIQVGAIVAVNAVGDIYNGAGNIIAGLRSEDGRTIFGTIKTLKGMVHDRIKILIDDNTSFIKRSEIEEAFAAAAKQFEREETSTASVETAEETIVEETIETAVEEPAEAVFEEPAVEPAEEFTEEPEEEPSEDNEVEVIEESAEAAEPEEPVESAEEFIAEEVEEVEAAEETEDKPEEPAEEFIPETPDASAYENRYREYAEISIPVVSAQPESVEEPEEEPSEVIEDIEEPAESDEPVEFTEEFIEEEAEATEEAEVISEEPVEEFNEESAEEFIEEPVEEFIPEVSEEEPVVLSREEMGYDIVFNTTISCLITNAALTKSQANKLASILHDAYARAIKPVHGTLDGDTVFVLATGKQQVNFDAFAALATDVMQYAIIDGAMSAESAYGLPAARDIQKTGE